MTMERVCVDSSTPGGSYSSKDRILKVEEETGKEYVAMFPGQGSQFVGMGKDLYQNFAYVRDLYEEASDAISFHLAKISFDGPELDLTLTENTQPALLVASIAALKVLEREMGHFPKIVMGHSLGEYSALVAAGAFSLQAAVKWVRERGCAMQFAVPAGQGTMAAILGLADSKVVELCHLGTQAAIKKRAEGAVQGLDIEAVVEPANYNAPNQIVIAGSKDAVDAAIRILRDDSSFQGGKAIPLTVSAPFHCRLMAPACDKMKEIFGQLTEGERPKPLRIPYIPNRTGSLTWDESSVIRLLIDQIDNAVLWKQSVNTVFDNKIHRAIEFGPGRVLSGLTKRIGHDAGKSCQIFQLSDVETLKSLETHFQEKK